MVILGGWVFLMSEVPLFALQGLNKPETVEKHGADQV